MPDAHLPPPQGASAPRSWRKRHPVAARLVLYTLGVALGLGLYAAWRSRQEQDRHDHIAVLWARLESLPVVLAADPDGPEVVKILDAEYVAPELPEALRARAERLRGVIARNRKDRAGVDAAFSRARALDPEEARATDLEWAQCLADLGDGVAARARLPADPARAGWGWAGTLWAVLVQAQADALVGSPAGARESLAKALERLPRPLPRERPFWFGLAPWQPSGAALEATRWLVLDLAFAAQHGRTAWTRLVELAPDDAEALLAAAEALLALGDEAAARRALELARGADPTLVSKAVAQRPGLAALRAR